MYIFIGIEILVANALIENFDINGKREVSFDAVVNYGMEVVRLLRKQTGKEGVLLLSEKQQIDMIQNYSNFFQTSYDNAGKPIFKLKSLDCLEDIKNYFRWAMSVELVDAFVAPEAVLGLSVLK